MKRGAAGPTIKTNLEFSYSGGLLFEVVFASFLAAFWKRGRVDELGNILKFLGFYGPRGVCAFSARTKK